MQDSQPLKESRQVATKCTLYIFNTVNSVRSSNYNKLKVCC